MGVIATPEVKNARKHIHALIDPLWKEKKIRRGKLYALLSEKMGYQYHTGELTCIEDARKVWVAAKEIIREELSNANNKN